MNNVNVGLGLRSGTLVVARTRCGLSRCHTCVARGRGTAASRHWIEQTEILTTASPCLSGRTTELHKKDEQHSTPTAESGRICVDSCTETVDITVFYAYMWHKEEARALHNLHWHAHLGGLNVGRAKANDILDTDLLKRHCIRVY